MPASPASSASDPNDSDLDVSYPDDEVVGWVLAAARAAHDKQAADVVVLDVGAVLAVTGWFVIAHGASSPQVKAIAEAVERGVLAAGGPKPTWVEGAGERHWVLIDYGDFVVHVFDAETRAYYELERLWSDVPRVDW